MLDHSQEGKRGQVIICSAGSRLKKFRKGPWHAFMGRQSHLSPEIVSVLNINYLHLKGFFIFIQPHIVFMNCSDPTVHHCHPIFFLIKITLKSLTFRQALNSELKYNYLHNMNILLMLPPCSSCYRINT